MNIKGTKALVTGGSSGLGKATAQFLIEKGAKVIITGRDENKLNAVAKEIGAIAIHSDAGKEDEIKQLFDQIKEDWGSLDILINNAGIGKAYKLEDLTFNAFEEVFRVNVFGAAITAKYAAELFKEKGKGNIVNIASTAALKGYPTGSVYCGSKFALRGMTQAWQAELRKHNIRVIQVNPSEVPTAFGSAERVAREDEPKKLTSMEIAHSIVGALEMDERGFIPELSVWATNPF